MKKSNPNTALAKAENWWRKLDEATKINIWHDREKNDCPCQNCRLERIERLLKEIKGETDGPL